MPTESPTPRTRRQSHLSHLLRMLRRRRGRSVGDVAAAVGMPLRSYQHFEAGQGKLEVERIYRFAQAVDVDFFAMVTALEIGSPAFALRCADNKFMTLLVLALADFNDRVGDDIARLDPHTLMTSFNAFFDELGRLAKERNLQLEAWMTDKAITGEDD